MLQIYLLSVLANLAAGLTLAGDYLGERIGFLSGFKGLRGNRGVAISLGVAATLIGLLKFVVRAPGDSVPVVGDFLPAVGGIAVGLTLLADTLQSREQEKTAETGVTKVAGSLLAYRVPIGISSVAIALLHFLFPRAVIF